MITKWNAEAREEYREAVRYLIDEGGISVAEKFVAHVNETLRIIVAHPALGSQFHSGTRRLVVRGFPYFVIYKLVENQLYVLALAHQRRRPRYWLRRR